MAAPNVFDHYSGARPAPGATDITTMQMTVAASTTIKPYDFLKLSSGQLVQAIAAPAAANYTVTNGISLVGVADEGIVTDSTGYTPVATSGGFPTNQINVMIADDRLNVLLRLLGVTATGSTAISSLGTASEVQDALPGANYSLGRYTNAAGTDSWYFVSKSTTTPELLLQELTADFAAAPVTTQFPTWWVKVVNAYRAMG